MPYTEFDDQDEAQKPKFSLVEVIAGALLAGILGLLFYFSRP